MTDYAECKHGLMRRFCIDCSPMFSESTVSVVAKKPRQAKAPKPPARSTQVILDAARALPQPFTLEQLVMAAWQAAPELFGLQGYPHPDSARVRCCLYAKKGPFKRGVLVGEDGGFRVAQETTHALPSLPQ